MRGILGFLIGFIGLPMAAFFVALFPTFSLVMLIWVTISGIVVIRMGRRP